MKPQGHEGQDPIGHETRDVSTRPIVMVVLGGAAVTLAFIAAMYVLVDVTAKREDRESPPANPLASTFARKEPPEPRLQTHPLRDLAGLRAYESETLSTYAWVDKTTGTVRVPIDRAKELLLTRGVGPVRGGTNP